MRSSSVQTPGGSRAIHQRLAADLRVRILSGSLPLGAALESENELCQRYAISRTPVRQALDILAREGLIRRIRGKGAFVTATTPSVAEGAEARHGPPRLTVVLDVHHSMAVSRNPILLGAMDALAQAAATPDAEAEISFRLHHFTGLGDPAAQDLFAKTDGVDGVVVVPFWPHAMTFLSHLQSASVPAVSLFRYIPGCALSQFYVDHERGAFMATDYLVRLGHERIAFLSLSPEAYRRIDGLPTSVLELRLAGYRRALRAAGVEPDPQLVLSPGPRRSEVEAATLALFDQTDKPTALLMGGGRVAPMGFAALDKAGIRIPDDLSVLAIDCPPAATDRSPQVGGVAFPMKRLAQRALDNLFSQMNCDEPVTPVAEAVTPELRIYESCRPIT